MVEFISKMRGYTLIGFMALIAVFCGRDIIDINNPTVSIVIVVDYSGVAEPPNPMK